jgi:hypothetical protein
MTKILMGFVAFTSEQILTVDWAFMPRKFLTMSADVVCWLQGSSCRRRGLPQLPEYRIRRGSLSRDRGINADGIDIVSYSPVWYKYFITGGIHLKHLSFTERCQIEQFLCLGFSFHDIAERLDRQTSTISREIQPHFHQSPQRKLCAFSWLSQTIIVFRMHFRSHFLQDLQWKEL